MAWASTGVYDVINHWTRLVISCSDAVLLLVPRLQAADDPRLQQRPALSCIIDMAKPQSLQAPSPAVLLLTQYRGAATVGINTA